MAQATKQPKTIAAESFPPAVRLLSLWPASIAGRLNHEIGQPVLGCNNWSVGNSLYCTIEAKIVA